MTVRIGIIGDFNANNPTRVATTSGIQHAADVLVQQFEAVWLLTDRPAEFGGTRHSVHRHLWWLSALGG
ncbi:MAG: hypothetical protein ACLPWF_14985 [Bryobacteraceae bacterium]